MLAPRQILGRMGRALTEPGRSHTECPVTTGYRGIDRFLIARLPTPTAERLPRMTELSELNHIHSPQVHIPA